jgi:hypothetical protein
MPTIGLAVVNFDNNQHAVNENLRVGHLWEAIDIFAGVGDDAEVALDVSAPWKRR